MHTYLIEIALEIAHLVIGREIIFAWLYMSGESHACMRHAICQVHTCMTARAHLAHAPSPHHTWHHTHMSFTGASSFGTWTEGHMMRCVGLVRWILEVTHQRLTWCTQQRMPTSCGMLHIPACHARHTHAACTCLYVHHVVTCFHSPLQPPSKHGIHKFSFQPKLGSG